MIEEIIGDITTTDCKIIAHGVNCQGVMGSGVALALMTKWPIIKASYLDYFDEFDHGIDGEKFLGKIDDCWIDRPNRKNARFVINCFTQQYYGATSGVQYLSYDALLSCLKSVRSICEYYNVKELAIPKIGCGLAGGNWNIVKSIIEFVFPEDFKVKVYSLE